MLDKETVNQQVRRALNEKRSSHDAFLKCLRRTKFITKKKEFAELIDRTITLLE